MGKKTCYVENNHSPEVVEPVKRLDYLFILESPFTEERKNGYPLAGDSRKSVSKILLDVDGEAFGKIIQAQTKG